MQHPTPQRACGRCGRTAVYRVALVGLDENPTAMLARRSHYRCPEHFLEALTPTALWAAAHAGQRVVVDAAFTAAALSVTP